MNNPVLEWALQTLQNPNELFISDPVSKALELIDIDASHIQINSQPLESIFSTIGENNTVPDKKLPLGDLDTQSIVYPKEQVSNPSLNITEPPNGWNRYENTNLALALIEKHGTFLSISQKYPNLSFYDVIKTAAAIHDCLEGGETENPFLMVSGDFSGIQETIYTISSSGALKTLRARSFMLELLTEHIIYEILQATTSERYSLIYSGGGGFSLLVSNTENNRKVIKKFGKVINTWMLEQFGIQLFLALHYEPFSPDDLKDRQFKDMWDLTGDKLGKQKQRKFWQSDNFKDMFKPKMPVHVENQLACQITHRDDLPETEMVLDGNERVSKLAYRLRRLGDRLTEIESVVRLKKLGDDFGKGTLLFPTHQSKPNRLQYAEYKVVKQLPQNNDYEVRWVVNSWDLNKYDENTYPLLFGEYVRSVAQLSKEEAQKLEKEEYKNDHNREMGRPESVTASFSGLAKAAQGSELVGCLRMDVDNMGEFFSQKNLTLGLGIIANSNLSRSLNLFFKGYINQICGMNLGVVSSANQYPLDITGKNVKKKESGRDVSIIYAGGDDLFIAGAWDDIAELAFDINACFKAFTCQNSDVNLSAGVTLHKPKFPLYQMARISKRAEEAAKKFKGQEVEAPKNSLSLFYSDDLAVRNAMLDNRIESESIRHPHWGQKFNRIAVASQWHEYDDMIQLTKQLHEAYQDISHGFYRKLFQTLKIWQEEGVMYMPMMFHIQKQIAPGSKLAKLKTLFFQHNYMRKLHIPLQWVEYLNR